METGFDFFLDREHRKAVCRFMFYYMQKARYRTLLHFVQDWRCNYWKTEFEIQSNLFQSCLVPPTFTFRDSVLQKFQLK